MTVNSFLFYFDSSQWRTCIRSRSRADSRHIYYKTTRYSGTRERTAASRVRTRQRSRESERQKSRNSLLRAGRPQSSLSRRLHPDHPRRAEHSKLVVSNQRSDLRRVWRAGHTCGMRCQGPVQPGATPMAIPEPAHRARDQHTRRVGDVVGVHCIGLR